MVIRRCNNVVTTFLFAGSCYHLLHNRLYIKGVKDVEADEWEISPESITKEKKIGSGAFGVVYSGTIDQTVLMNSKYAKHPAAAPLLLEKNPMVAIKLLSGKILKNLQ